MSPIDCGGMLWGSDYGWVRSLCNWVGDTQVWISSTGCRVILRCMDRDPRATTEALCN